MIADQKPYQKIAVPCKVRPEQYGYRAFTVKDITCIAALVSSGRRIGTESTRTFLGRILLRLRLRDALPDEPTLVRLLIQAIEAIPKESRLTAVDCIASALQGAIEASAPDARRAAPSPLKPKPKPEPLPLSPPRPLSPSRLRSMSQALKEPVLTALGRHRQANPRQPAQPSSTPRNRDAGKVRGWQFYQGTRFILIPTGGRGRKR
jgi:hypothetical protein